MSADKNEKTNNDKPFLTYTVSSNPSPLEISTDTPTPGEITFSVGKKDNVFCKRIVIYIPTGGVAGEIFSKVPPVVTKVSSKNWSPSIEVKTGKELGFEDALEYTVINLANNTSEYKVTESFTVTASGNVNKLLGPATIKLNEKSSHNSSTGYNYKKITFPILKSAAPGFYIRNFVAILPGTPTVPATEFSNGTEFQLSWESNGTYYELYKKDKTIPIYSGTATWYKATGGISTDTTFVLMAKSAQVVLYDTITITVSNPSLTPKTDDVTGNATVGGTLSVTGFTKLGNVTASGTLGVTGETTLGNVTASGTLDVTGDTALSNVKASGTLDVTGETTLQSATVSKKISIWTDGNTEDNAVFISSKSDTNSTLCMYQNGKNSAAYMKSNSDENPTLSVCQAGSSDAAEFQGRVLVGEQGNNDDLGALLRVFPKAGTDQMGMYIQTENAHALQLGNYSPNQTVAVAFAWGNNATAFFGKNQSKDCATFYAENSGSDRYYEPWGFYSNARHGTSCGEGFYTHLPTKKDHRVVTSPMVLEKEIHFSGSGKIVAGRGRVQFDEFDQDVRDIMAEDTGYRVLLTPVGKAVLLAVEKKEAEGFTVIAGDEVDMEFDWYVVARKPGSHEDKKAEKMPDALLKAEDMKSGTPEPGPDSGQPPIFPPRK